MLSFTQSKEALNLTKRDMHRIDAVANKIWSMASEWEALLIPQKSPNNYLLVEKMLYKCYIK